jgi:hypothetical protein
MTTRLKGHLQKPSRPNRDIGCVEAAGAQVKDEAVDVGDGGLRTQCQDDTVGGVSGCEGARGAWPALCGLIEPYYDVQPELIEIAKGTAAPDVGGVIAAARCTRSPRSFSCP